MRLFQVLLVFVLLLPAACALPHAQYPSFASPESRLSFVGDAFSATDSIIYKTAHVSLGGEPWQAVELSGTPYQSSSQWLAGSASLSLSPYSFPTGEESYLLAYSCMGATGAWDCHETSGHPDGFWQLLVIAGSNASNTSDEPDYSCSEGQYYFEDACLLNVTGRTYFLAPDGDDATGDGSIASPWRTLNKAVTVVAAGDIVYLRGGVYDLSKSITIYNKDGTAEKPVRYHAFPGEEPILDFSGWIPIQDSANQQGAIFLYNLDHYSFKGFTVRNVNQVYYDNIVVGIRGYGSTNITFTNMVIHDVQGKGFRFYDCDDVSWYNCDAYNCADPLRDTPGNGGTGFNCGGDIEGASYYHYGCRAYNNSDQGFSGAGEGLGIYDNCWSWGNGYMTNGAGCGFKFGFEETLSAYRRLTNCIAAYNYNDDPDAAWPANSGFNDNAASSLRAEMELYNNIAYKNGLGFIVTTPAIESGQPNIYRNNIAYDNQNGNIFETTYIHSNNSWDSSPAITITHEDFVALPETIEEAYAVLGAPRKADGSLPDMGGCFQLAAGSDLIDAGADVGLPFSGSAPDLGPFERQG